MSTRARIAPYLKAGVALSAIAFIVSRQPWSELRAALASLSAGALGASIGCLLVGIVLGTLRWRFVLIAYGATTLPPLPALLRMYFVGLFYNTYLPFSVGGDVVRGVAARSAFGEGGASASVASVLIERALGLSGVLVLTLVAIGLQGDHGPARAVLGPALLALACVLVGTLCIPLARHSARFAPLFARPHLARIPSLHSYPAFLLALAISLGTQLAIVFTIHQLASAAAPHVTLVDSMFVAPLAAAAAYLPISIAGIGPRDVVLVALFELVGVPRAQGTAVALAFLVVSLVVSLVGGALELASVRTRGA